MKPIPIPQPTERVTVGDFFSRTWWRALSSITGQALGGTVTEIDAGEGLTGGPITESGTIKLKIPVSPEDGGTGLTGPYANGQLLIGNSLTGKLVAKTLTAGANMTITNAPGSITLASTGGGGGGGSGILGIVSVVTATGNVYFT